jgi:transposase
MSCGAHGHAATPDHRDCSRAFRAVVAIKKRRLSMREAAELFGVLPGTIAEALKRDPGAWRIALRAGRDRRKPRQRSVLVELAVAAVRDDGLSVRDAAASYGVHPVSVYRVLRALGTNASC